MVQCCWRSSLTSDWTHHISKTPGLSPWFVLSPKCSQSWGLTINESIQPTRDSRQIRICLALVRRLSLSTKHPVWNEFEWKWMSQDVFTIQNVSKWIVFELFWTDVFQGIWRLLIASIAVSEPFQSCTKLWKHLWISTATLVLVGVFRACLLAGRETWGRSGALRRVECLNSAKQRKQRKQIIPGWPWKFWTPEDSQTMPDISTGRVLTLGDLLIKCLELECRSKYIL